MKKNTSILWQTCAAFAAVALLAVGCSEEEPGSELMAPYCHVNANEVTVTRTTATLTGQIEAANPASIKEYGFRYSTSSTLNKDDKTTVTVKLGDSLEGSGSVQTLIKDLSPNTTYYYCLYTSTGVSESVSTGENYFRTAETSSPIFTELVKDSIGENFARIRCSVEEIGDTYLLEYGVAYKKLKDKTFVSIPADTLDDEATRSFTVELSELDPATQYVIRAYAKNSSDTDANTGVREGYSVNDTITTENLLAAEIEGYEPSEVLSTSAKISGQVLGAAGSGGKVEEIGVCYSETNEYPVWTDSKVVIEGTDLKKVYTATLTGLKEYTQYYARMYAKNIVDGKERYGYGEVQMFTTTGLKKPDVQFGEENTSDATSFTMSAVINNYDEAALVEKGFIWSLTNGEITLEEAEKNNTKLVVTDGGKTYTGHIVGLPVGTSYFVRAYAVYRSSENEQIGYSGAYNMYTLSFDPAYVQSVERQDLTALSVKLVGKVGSNGTGTIVKRGFVLSTDNSMDVTLENCQMKIEAGEDFTEQVTGLLPNTTYYVRAYVVCELGDKQQTVYSWNDSFMTPQFEGITFGNTNWDYVKATSIQLSTMIVVTAGEVIEKGVCWIGRSSTGEWVDPTLENCMGYQKAEGTDFVVTMTGLTPSTEYTYRHYVKMQVEAQTFMVYSYVSSISTAGLSVSEVSQTITNQTYAYCFRVNYEGGDLTEYGFYWTTNPDEQTPATKKAATLADGQYTLTLDGLAEGTTYYLRAYYVIDGVTYTEHNRREFTTKRTPAQGDNQSPDIKN